MNAMVELEILVPLLLYFVVHGVLLHDRLWSIAKPEVICDVSHVHLAKIEDVAELFREGFVVTNPRCECCRKKNETN